MIGKGSMNVPEYDDRCAADREALEAMRTPELRELLERMLDLPEPTEAESSAMLMIMDVLSAREDYDAYVRLDAAAALETFRETFLPSVDMDADADEGEQAEPKRHAARKERPVGSLPAFLAAFAAGKRPSEQEIDEIQRMIDAFRKEQ